MIFTCTNKPDSDGKYHVKVDGKNIGHIRQEKRTDKKIVWAWSTLAIAVHNNQSGATDSLENAREAIKKSHPRLIEKRNSRQHDTTC